MVCGHLVVLDTHRQVFDPPTWSGAASTTLYGGRGDPHPSWISSLVESGIKVTGKPGMSLSGLAFVASQGVPERDLVAKKSNTISECFNNVD